jgi:hypothetical protein
VVQALPPGGAPSANGLPTFPIYFENDDDSRRQLGKDSKVIFEAPETGSYVVRVRDVTGAGGEGYHYELIGRQVEEDFKVSIAAKTVVVSPGTGREVAFNVERMDEFEGEIAISVSGLPPCFSMVSPILVEKEQVQALAVLFAEEGAERPEPEAWKAVKVSARALVAGQSVEKALGNLGKIELGEPAKVKLEILADGEVASPRVREDGLLELSVAAGETIRAVVRATRAGGFEGEIPLGKEDSGRNLPFGVVVENVGLNGLLILQQEAERNFFLRAGPRWLTTQERVFHLRTTLEGGITSRPVVLKVKAGEAVAGR